jgi:DNA-binding NtrC family response regulator
MPSRLLIIDDDPSGLMAMAEAFRQRLPETMVDTASNTRTALSLLRETPYHLVISDIRMNELDGMTLLNQVRERWPEIPVILMTAAGLDREAEALVSGAFAYIEKPIDVARLVPIAQAAMEKCEMRRRVLQANNQSLRHLHEAQRSRRDADTSVQDPPESPPESPQSES